MMASEASRKIFSVFFKKTDLCQRILQKKFTLSFVFLRNLTLPEHASIPWERLRRHLSDFRKISLKKPILSDLWEKSEKSGRNPSIFGNFPIFILIFCHLSDFSTKNLVLRIDSKTRCYNMLNMLYNIMLMLMLML